MKAVWNNAVIAESDETIVIEGDYYFPPSSVRHEYLRPSETHTSCPWKGLESYYTVEVAGQAIKDGAWYHPAPKPGAQVIKDYVAFWRGVEIVGHLAPHGNGSEA